MALDKINRVRLNNKDIEEIYFNNIKIWPRRYTPLNYLQSDGNQYIDSGITINGAEIKFAYVTKYNQDTKCSAFGARDFYAPISNYRYFGMTIYNNNFHSMPEGYGLKSWDTSIHILKHGSQFN